MDQGQSKKKSPWRGGFFDSSQNSNVKLDEEIDEHLLKFNEYRTNSGSDQDEKVKLLKFA
jgi:hypothetical protein